MKIISIIDDYNMIELILKHLNLWDIRNHDPLETEPVYIPELTYTEDSGLQIPVFDTFCPKMTLPCLLPDCNGEMFF